MQPQKPQDIISISLPQKTEKSTTHLHSEGTNEPQRQKTYLRVRTSGEASDQPTLPHSLIRIFTGCILDSQGCKVSSCRQRWLWSDCADAQADLSISLALMLYDTFSHIATQLSTDGWRKTSYSRICFSPDGKGQCGIHSQRILRCACVSVPTLFVRSTFKAH